MLKNKHEDLLSNFLWIRKAKKLFNCGFLGIIGNLISKLFLHFWFCIICYYLPQNPNCLFQYRYSPWRYFKSHFMSTSSLRNEKTCIWGKCSRKNRKKRVLLRFLRVRIKIKYVYDIQRKTEWDINGTFSLTNVKKEKKSETSN